MTNVFETLHSLLLRAATSNAECAAYKSWTAEFVREQVIEAWTMGRNIRLPVPRFTAADIATLTPEQLSFLGFNRWSEDEPLYLIPLWAWNFIADGESVKSINGKTTVKTDELDLDNRFGCTAYGFVIGSLDDDDIVLTDADIAFQAAEGFAPTETMVMVWLLWKKAILKSQVHSKDETGNRFRFEQHVLLTHKE